MRSIEPGISHVSGRLQPAQVKFCFSEISLDPDPKSPSYPSPSRSFEGRCATSRNAERDAVDAGCALDGRCGWRTAKACGPDAPTLASSPREAIPADDG